MSNQPVTETISAKPSLRIRVRWVKSAIGYPPEQKRTLRALGLRRLGQAVEHDDTPQVRGMLTTVRHLVHVQAVD